MSVCLCYLLGDVFRNSNKYIRRTRPLFKGRDENTQRWVESGRHPPNCCLPALTPVQEPPRGAGGAQADSGVTLPPCVPAAVPSHPYGVTLLNCDGHSMTLGWKVPRFSGGAPILGYYIDKREAQHKNWHEVNSSPVKERILTVGSSGFTGLRSAFVSRAESFLRRLRH